MRITTVSPAVLVPDVDRARDFYTTHFGGRVTFDCGWYVNMELGPDGPPIQFMQPQSPNQKEYRSGLTLNLRLENVAAVDAMHGRLTDAGLPMVMELKNHPWGDRGFCTLDPYGVALYVYADTEPSEEFRQYFK